MIEVQKDTRSRNKRRRNQSYLSGKEHWTEGKAQSVRGFPEKLWGNDFIIYFKFISSSIFCLTFSPFSPNLSQNILLERALQKCFGINNIWAKLVREHSKHYCRHIGYFSIASFKFSVIRANYHFLFVHGDD